MAALATRRRREISRRFVKDCPKLFHRQITYERESGARTVQIVRQATLTKCTINLKRASNLKARFYKVGTPGEREVVGD